MSKPPEFPHLKHLQMEDREFIHEKLRQYRPQTSEWTFTNLFIWHAHYHFHWSTYQDWVLIVCEVQGQKPYALQPIGPSSRLEPTLRLLAWMEKTWGTGAARIERADERLVSELGGNSGLMIEPTREHFDYIYQTTDLIKLNGRKYHGKRNHLNKFRRHHSFSYASLHAEHIASCLDLSESWCEWRRCEEDLNLTGESEAIRHALKHFQDLEIQGGVILMGDSVKAFALGELVNDQMAVVHIEKADPQIPGLYALINQQFCEHAWQDVPWINREQDLGEPGLRKAKLSYVPDHLIEKYRITLSSGPAPVSSRD
ncbi:DUF2156 domain-containing protein [Thermodesulfobacteriota bacterium]